VLEGCLKGIFRTFWRESGCLATEGGEPPGGTPRGFGSCRLASTAYLLLRTRSQFNWTLPPLPNANEAARNRPTRRRAWRSTPSQE
jgi:hypothetical protein